MTSVSTRERLLLSAERLIGERGIEVSLREIASDAGQRNTAAVHYHFGNRDALIEAVVDWRQQALEAARLALLGELDAEHQTDLRSLLDALVKPMFEIPYAAGATHYARFLEKVRDHPALAYVSLEEHHWEATKQLLVGIAGALGLGKASLEAVQVRLRSMTTTMLALLTDAERQFEQTGRRPTEADAEAVVDMLVGLLTVPPRN